MLALPSENDSVALTSDGVMWSPSSFLGQEMRASLSPDCAMQRGSCAHLAEHELDLRVLQLTLGLRSGKQQIEQVVVRQVHQRLQSAGLFLCDRRLVPSEEALDEQVVFKQPAPATPLQLAQRAWVQGGLHDVYRSGFCAV